MRVKNNAINAAESMDTPGNFFGMTHMTPKADLLGCTSGSRKFMKFCNAESGTPPPTKFAALIEVIRGGQDVCDEGSVVICSIGDATRSRGLKLVLHADTWKSNYFWFESM